MEKTTSYREVFKSSLLNRYEFAEVRNAAATLFGTAREEFNDISIILDEFELSLESLTDAGGNKGVIAQVLDTAFRERGWREAGHHTQTTFTFRIAPYYKAGERHAKKRVQRFSTAGHKVDNVKGRIALDVEWNAKDGNLDRDLANFRALHDAAVIDVGVIITRHQERTKWAANQLAAAAAAGRVRHDKNGRRIVLLATTTTTNMEKLVPRLERGDGGGCPVLAIAITDRCYVPRPGEPSLPGYSGSFEIQGVADDTEETTDPRES